MRLRRSHIQVDSRQSKPSMTLRSFYILSVFKHLKLWNVGAVEPGSCEEQIKEQIKSWGNTNLGTFEFSILIDWIGPPLMAQMLPT